MWSRHARQLLTAESTHVRPPGDSESHRIDSEGPKHSPCIPPGPLASPQTTGTRHAHTYNSRNGHTFEKGSISQEVCNRFVHQVSRSKGFGDHTQSFTFYVLLLGLWIPRIFLRSCFISSFIASKAVRPKSGEQPSTQCAQEDRTVRLSNKHTLLEISSNSAKVKLSLSGRQEGTHRRGHMPTRVRARIAKMEHIPPEAYCEYSKQGRVHMRRPRLLHQEKDGRHGSQSRVHDAPPTSSR